MHMYISPRPSNLGESREIMRLLSQFGEIEYYKNLKYEGLSQPRSATVIYREESAANECLRRSPIRFRMGRVKSTRTETEEEQSEAVQDEVPAAEVDSNGSVQRGPLGMPFGLGAQTRSMSTHSKLPKPPRTNNNAYMPFSSPSDPPAYPFGPQKSRDDPTLDADSRIFEIIVNRSTRNYRDRINHGHYHSTFAIDSKNVGQGDLIKKVPVPGLSDVDWRHEDKPWRVVSEAREQEYSGLKKRVRLGRLWEEAGHKAKWEERRVEAGLDGAVGVGVETSEKVSEQDPAGQEPPHEKRDFPRVDVWDNEKLAEMFDVDGLGSFAEQNRGEPGNGPPDGTGYLPFHGP